MTVSDGFDEWPFCDGSEAFMGNMDMDGPRAVVWTSQERNGIWARPCRRLPS